MKQLLILFMAVMTASLFGQNLINNPGFEDGDDKWTTSGAEFEISEQARTGDSAAMVSIVGKSYQGIRPRTTKIELIPGDYVASFWAKAGDNESVGKKASIKVESNIGLGTDESVSAELNESEWVQIYKEFTITTLDSVKVNVRANNVDKQSMVMYVDDVLLARKSIDYFDGDCEAGDITNNWTDLNTGVIHRTTDPDSVRTGHGACVLTVNASNDGYKNISDLDLNGQGSGNYVLSVWVKGMSGEDCQLRAKVVESKDKTSYKKTDYTIVETGVWEKIELSFSVPNDTTTIGPMFRQVTADGVTTFALDDFVIEKEIPTSIGEKKESSFKIYPNPASSVITLQGVEAGTSYEVYTTAGQTLSIATYQASGIDVSSMADGVYFIKVGGEVVRFIVKK